MSILYRLLLTLTILSALVAGCSQAKPTATPLPPTNISAPTAVATGGTPTVTPTRPSLATPTNTPIPPTPIPETPQPTSTPSPSLDGRGDGTIAFYSDRDGNPEIYVMNADGSDLRRLTDNDATDQAPAWSPDGTQIAFVSDRDGNREIYVMNADGSEPQRLTDNPAYESHPAWSPDGTQIAFISERDGNREIYILDADGSNVQRLTSWPRITTTRTQRFRKPDRGWPPFSPLSKAAAGCPSRCATTWFAIAARAGTRSSGVTCCAANTTDASTTCPPACSP